MPARPRAAISWSGGKDSLAALTAARAGYDVVASVTMFDTEGVRSRSHGLRPELVAAQASRLGLRPFAARCDWATYNAAFTRALAALRRLDVSHVVFGDILFPEHRAWAEARSAEAGMTAIEPLWGLATGELFDRFCASGATALLVTVRRPFFDEQWLGRTLDASMKPLFAERGVDPCGEMGEYHTAVVDGPAFSSPIAVKAGSSVERGECFALDLVPTGPAGADLEWVAEEPHGHAPRG
jgi:uncharacterized protein (TIGR00290 family)